MEKNRIPVPGDVLDGIEAVRVSGKTNMLDAPMVVFHAQQMGFPEAAAWVDRHQILYAHGVFRGFEPTEGLDEDVLREMAERILRSERSDEGCADR